MTPGLMESWNWTDLRRRALPLLDSPANLWTAVATGRSEHGVGRLEEQRPVGLSAPVPGTVPLADLMQVLLPGRRMAVSARMRTAKTLWEILAHEEGIACIGWWATWPALAREGQGPPFEVVSDRALFALQRPSAGRFLIAPDGLERRLNAEFEADLQAVRQEVSARLSSQESSPSAETQRRVEQSALIDGYALRIALKLLDDPTISDLFLYLPGLDIAQTGSSGESPPYSEFLMRYQVWIADRLEQLDAELEPEDRMVLLALPGRGAAGPGEGGARWGRVLTREPRPSTVVDGPELVARSMDVLDIAPTLLNLRGFPVSRDMEGKSVAIFEDPSRPPALIDTYGRNTLPSIPFSASSEEDERETLERLRSLGYLN